jgi:hypothetical protein
MGFLSRDFRVPTLSIECEPCGGVGRYNVAKLIEQYGDAKLPDLRHILANCPKAGSQSIHDRCRVRPGPACQRPAGASLQARSSLSNYPARLSVLAW